MNAPSLEEVADFLDQSADFLLVGGWVQGRFNLGERHCTLGVLFDRELRDVDLTSFLGAHAANALQNYLGLHDPRMGKHPLAVWNDADERTEDDVHDALRNCAKALREVAQ